jgi:hypothetical protein
MSIQMSYFFRGYLQVFGSECMCNWQHKDGCRLCHINICDLLVSRSHQFQILFAQVWEVGVSINMV